MEFAVQDIKFIKDNMIDSVEDWVTLLKDPFIFKVPEFISFISEYPMDWFIMSIKKIANMLVDIKYIDKLLKCRKELEKELLPFLVSNDNSKPLISFRIAYKHIKPQLRLIFKIIKFRNFNEVDKVLQWVYRRNKRDFVQIINYPPYEREHISVKHGQDTIILLLEHVPTITIS